MEGVIVAVSGERLQVSALFGLAFVAFAVQVLLLRRHPISPEDRPVVQSLKRVWRRNLRIVSPLAAFALVASIVVLVQALTR